MNPAGMPVCAPAGACRRVARVVVEGILAALVEGVRVTVEGDALVLYRAALGVERRLRPIVGDADNTRGTSARIHKRVRPSEDRPARRGPKGGNEICASRVLDTWFARSDEIVPSFTPLATICQNSFGVKHEVI